MCETCKSSEDGEDKRLTYTYLKLFDHWVKEHENSPIKILLNLFELFLFELYH